MNNRLFAEHRIRKTVSLDGLWGFWTKGGETASMIVPGCWEFHPALASYRGEAEYQKEIRCGGNVRFVFEGVSHTAKAVLDGKLLGEHYGAYGAFSFVAKDLAEGVHRLKVHVDNRFREDSALHVPNDYYTYGGITRPVRLELLSGAYIRQMHIASWLHVRTGDWESAISVEVENLEERAKELLLSFTLAGEVYAAPVSLEAGEVKTVSWEMEFDSVKPYIPRGLSGTDPVLYEAEAVLYENRTPIDDLIDRVGFRQVEVSGKDILWNGQKLVIKGFNRHEDYGDFGCAVPLEAMYRDIELIKQTGANCVRTCHYPNDPRFLDLCDENGILVWEEAHARGLRKEQMSHPLFMMQSLLSVREMIGQHYNHPSVFVWGLLNECASDTEEGSDSYRRLIGEIRSLDASRPVTFASCHHFSDRCLGMADIVSFNIYPGWYVPESTPEFLQKLKAYIATTEGAGKPLLISEIGAGAVYGFRSGNKAKWTEERQEELLREQIRGVLGDPDCSGVILWQFADCRVDESWFSSRPKSQNNKGVVDSYRREKLAYRAVCEEFRKGD